MDLVKEIVEEAVEKELARSVRSMKQKGETEERIADLLDIPLEKVLNILKDQQ